MQPPISGASESAAPPPDGLIRLVRDRIVDAELAALVWIMVEARTPVVVVGQAGAAADIVADALADALPAGSRLCPVAADDEFGWLPEASTLGWREVTPAGRAGDRTADELTADPGTDVLVARDLADARAGGPAGDRARLVVRALSRGYGMLATMRGGSLEDAFDRLGAPEVGTDEDERSRLGIVLVMADPGAGAPRVAAAHYVRPVALDTHGHVQRLPPAVLATRNPAADGWDHFAWGVLPDLGGRIGVGPRDLEREQARRAAALAR